MVSEKLSDSITFFYPQWLNYTKKVCVQNNLIQEANDILHEVICYTLEKHRQKMEELCEGSKNSPDLLNLYIVAAIKNNILHPTAPFRQLYFKGESKLQREAEPLVYSMPEEEAQENLFPAISDIFNQLDIPLYKRRIFEFYYFENHKLKEWPGPESVSRLSKICKQICGMIRSRLVQKGVIPCNRNYR